MATKRKAKERVQNYPDLFEGIEGIAYGGSLSTTKNTHTGAKPNKGYNYKGKEKTSREKRNMKLWDTLYPTSTKLREG